MNGRTELHTFKSAIAQRLEDTAWILDRDGNVQTPALMTQEDLAPGLSAPQSGSLLNEIGFGRQAAVTAEQESQRIEAATSLGFTSTKLAEDLAAVCQRLTEEGRSEDEVRSRLAGLLTSQTEADMPTEPSRDPERRRDVATGDAESAPERLYEERNRSVLISVPGQSRRTKFYLRNHYTDTNGDVRCQICREKMPFQVSGEDYFEAVQFIPRQQKEFHQNRLALCPVCAAKYMHARATEDAALLEQLLDESLLLKTLALELTVTLAGERKTIWFAEKHAIDLRAALAASTRDGVPANS